MKKQIDKLVKLGTEILSYYYPLRLVNHNDIYNDEICISVYYASDDRKTQSIAFEKIEIKYYSDKIDFPYNYNYAKLEYIYNISLNAFKKIKKEQSNNLEKEIKLSKNKRIAALEKELNKLRHEKANQKDN